MVGRLHFVQFQLKESRKSRTELKGEITLAYRILYGKEYAPYQLHVYLAGKGIEL